MSDLKFLSHIEMMRLLRWWGIYRPTKLIKKYEDVDADGGGIEIFVFNDDEILEVPYFW